MDLRPGPGSPPVALYVTAWAPALANLRQLSLGTGHRLLRLVTSLGGLSALRRMSISGRVEIDPAVRLPPNLEFLAYRDCVGSTLPQQIGHCSSLTTLSLDLGPVPAEGFTILPRLSRLQHLQLADCPFLPTCLSQLTALEELALTRAGFDKGEPELATATLDRALRHLQQLTSLSIVESSGIDISVLDTVAGLSRLQRCSLIQRWSSEDGGLHALPDGPWHDSLRCLAADWELLHPSADVLANFTHLEHVWAMIARYYSCADGADFWRWARTHPSLQKLRLGSGNDYSVDHRVLVEALRLTQARPQLQVKTADEPPFYEDEFTSAFIF